MKRIKKYIAMLLALAVVISIPISVYAQGTEKPIMPTTGGSDKLYLGDINGDGKVTATDARKILRIATKLEKAEDYPNAALVADVNGDGKITAVDARKVLRVATKLEVFENPIVVIETTTEEHSIAETTEAPTTEAPTTEAPTTAAAAIPDNIPEEIVAFCSGKYYIEADFNSSGEKQFVKMATKGDASEFIIAMDDMEMGFYIKGKTQLLLNYSNKTYTKLSDIVLLMESMGESADLTEELNVEELVFGKINIDSATSEKSMIDGKEAEIWTIVSGETKLYFTVIDGNVKNIKSDDKSYSIENINLSVEIPADFYIANSKKFKQQTAIGFFKDFLKL